MMIPENHVSLIIHQQVEEMPEIDIRNWQTAEDYPADALHYVSERAKAGTTSRAKIVKIRIENLSLNFRYGFFSLQKSYYLGFIFRSLKMMKTLYRHYKYGCPANLNFDWIRNVGIYSNSKGRRWSHHLFACFAVFFNDC